MSPQPDPARRLAVRTPLGRTEATPASGTASPADQGRLQQHRRIVRWTVIGGATGILMAAVGAWSISAGTSLLRGYLMLLMVLGPMLTLLVVIGFGAHMVEYGRR